MLKHLAFGDKAYMDVLLHSGSKSEIKCCIWYVQPQKKIKEVMFNHDNRIVAQLSQLKFKAFVI